MLKKQRRVFILKLSAILFVLFINIFSLMAQPDPGGDEPTCWPPPCIPIDGGISLLVAAGIAFGVKKVLDLKSKEGRQAQ